MDSKEQQNIDRLSKLLQSRTIEQVALETMLVLLIAIASLVGNSLVCYVFYKRPRLRTVTNVYVGALAISDVLMAVFVMPWTVGILIKGKWVFSNTVCEIQGFVALLSAWTSLHIITLAAINRYFCVVKSHLYKRCFTIKSSVTMVAVTITTVIVVIVIPIICNWSQFTFRPGKGTCFMTFYQNVATIRKAYIGMNVFVYFCLPMTVISCCYFKVFKNVRNHVTVIQHSLRGRSKCDNKIMLHMRELRVTRTLFCMVIGFVVCWIPVAVVETLNSFLGIASLPRPAYLCYMVFAYVSGAVNPIIYAAVNLAFRRQLLDMLPWTSVKEFTCTHQLTHTGVSTNNHPDTSSTRGSKRRRNRHGLNISENLQQPIRVV